MHLWSGGALSFRRGWDCLVIDYAPRSSCLACEDRCSRSLYSSWRLTGLLALVGLGSPASAAFAKTMRSWVISSSQSFCRSGAVSTTVSKQRKEGLKALRTNEKRKRLFGSGWDVFWLSSAFEFEQQGIGLQFLGLAALISFSAFKLLGLFEGNQRTRYSFTYFSLSEFPLQLQSLAWTR